MTRRTSVGVGFGRLRRVSQHLLSSATASERKHAPKGGPLAGIKVVDLTDFQNGPSATQQMADNGADVIKVEPPTGNAYRVIAPPTKDFNPAMEGLNRGKRSIVVDLKHPSALKVMEKLVKWGDVVTENFRGPSVMKKMGLTYETMKKWNPKIIYVANSGLGPVGPLAERPSFDHIAQATSGAMVAQGGGPTHKPTPVEWAFSDEVGAMNFYSTILAAIISRNTTGEGQMVETSQLGATLHFQRNSIQAALKGGRQRDDGVAPGQQTRMIQLHRASDGKWIIISMAGRDQFKAFCEKVINRPDFLTDDRTYQTEKNLAAREAFREDVAKIIATQTRDYWLDMCDKAGKVPAAPCSSYEELGDPNSQLGKHLRENGYIMNVEHRDGYQPGDKGNMKEKFGREKDSTVTIVGPPARFHGTPAILPSGSWNAPDIGEQTSEVLAEIGFDGAEAAEFMADKGPTPPATGRAARTR